jgi:phosphoenolpyruvate-protein phosphotransferase
MTSEALQLYAFVGGTVVPLETVPDPVFAGGLMGEGVAIEPCDSVLRAPCAGMVAHMHASRHACVIETEGGARVLLHIGLDTVLMLGEGFVACVRAGDTVVTGQPLIEFDPDAIRRHGKATLTVLAVENSSEHGITWRSPERQVAAGDALLRLAMGSGAMDAVTSPSDQEIADGWATVRHAGGLHARPSALVATALKPYAACVDIMSRGRKCNARSATAMMGLAISEGEEVLIHAQGSDAGAAMEAVIAALETVTAAKHAPQIPAAEHPEGLTQTPTNVPGQLAGVVASPGLALGPAAHLVHEPGNFPETGEGVAPERRALLAAVNAVIADIEAAVAESRRRGLEDQADIFAAHHVLADDPELLAQAQAAIDAGKSAAFAWRATLQSQIEVLQASGSALLIERASDLRDIQRQVLRKLTGEGALGSTLPSGAVVLAEDLAPSDFPVLERARVAAIAIAGGGPTSHVAILARAQGIPMLVALGPQLSNLVDAQLLVVDADHGVLELCPDTDRVQVVTHEIERRAAQRREALTLSLEPARTLDGQHIEVAANVANAADAAQAVALGAEAVGLLRTELLFLERTSAPSVSEQSADVQAVLDAMQGRTVIVRTLDVGADKSLSYIPMPAEENPALGLRGVRLSLAREPLMSDQFRAILAVQPLSSVRIMLPMVVDVQEVRQARSLLDNVAAQAGIDSHVSLGVMIETPAAALLADQLAEVADFFSIGTNDLTQYTLCMDRGNPALAARLDGLHPAVLRLIAQAAAGAARHGRWTGVCGTLASDLQAVPLLIGLGVSELSASPAVLPEVKAVVRRLDAEECRKVAEQALQLDSPAAIRALVRTSWSWLGC